MNTAERNSGRGEEPGPTGGADTVPQDAVGADAGGAAERTGLPGVDVPDARGRTGLDRAGRDLTRNPNVRITDVELVGSGWHVLRATTFDYLRRDGRWTSERRETYDRGNGACVLLYDPDRGTVLLTRQFRYPVYVNGHPDGMLIEVAAGLLDEDDPETAVRREAEEETGVRIGDLHRVFDVYMSPGSVTERLHFFAATYDGARRSAGGAGGADGLGAGGGIADEGEDIEVLELPFTEALAAIRTGEIADAKTVLLLQWAALEGPFSGPHHATPTGPAGDAGPAGGELPETD